MERLAKEKISKQQQILLLRRELSSQLDNIDSALLFPEADLANGVRERGKHLGRGWPGPLLDEMKFI